MILAIVLVPIVSFVGFAVWKFFGSEWTNQTWRTRRSGTANNWKNEGYMASEDGHNWAEIDGTIAASAPPRGGTSGGNGGVF